MLDLGGEIEVGEVTRVEPFEGGFAALTAEGDRFEGAALILAPGVKHRHLGLVNEEALAGNGVCYCAVCDGDFYRGREVVMVGGGNSALQESLLLADVASHLTVVQNLDFFTGEAPLAAALLRRENVRVIFGAVVTALNEENGALCGCEILHSAGGRT